MVRRLSVGNRWHNRNNTLLARFTPGEFPNSAGNTLSTVLHVRNATAAAGSLLTGVFVASPRSALPRLSSDRSI